MVVILELEDSVGDCGGKLGSGAVTGDIIRLPKIADKEVDSVAGSVTSIGSGETGDGVRGTGVTVIGSSSIGTGVGGVGTGTEELDAVAEGMGFAVIGSRVLPSRKVSVLLIEDLGVAQGHGWSSQILHPKLPLLRRYSL